LDVPVPVIAAMNGHAIGGGFGLGLVCDIRVANREARYGANFARLGLHSGMAISYLLPRVCGVPRAAELLFTGRVFSGAEAAELGIANHAVEPGQVLARARELADEIAANAPVAVRMMKRSLYRGLEWDPRLAGEIEALLQSRTLEMADAKEGVAALLEKRAPRFRGV
ncbi:MAG TPA: enoyl-CoA hydratase-related protein, partial [Burkholderiaceae bacterium]|nr:enoyl-CoA hydratase-related protein [Burkholderiaceae bacterium]